MLAVAVALTVLVSVPHWTTNEADKAAVQALLDHLSDLKARYDGRSIRLMYTFWLGHGSSAVPSDPALLEEHLAQKIDVTVAFSEHRYAIVRNILDARGQMSYTKGGYECFMWDGIQSRTKVSTGVEGTYRGIIRGAPPPGDLFEGYMLAFGWLPGENGGVHLADYFDEHRTRIEVIRDDAGGVVGWRVVIPEQLSRVAVVGSLDKSQGPQIDEIRFTDYTTQKDVLNATNHSAEAIVSFEPSGFPGFEDATLVKRARLGSEEPIWNLNECRILRVEPCSGGDAFRVPFEPPDAIIDTRYDIAYTLGESRFSMDGIWVYTDKPLLEDTVGDNIAEWISRGEVEEYLPAERFVKERAIPYGSMIAAASCLLLAVVVLRARRYAK